MLPAGKMEAELPCYRPSTSSVHYTTSCNPQSSAPENGRDQRPKHIELNGIINKPLLLYLVGVYIIYINDARSDKYQISSNFIFHIFSKWKFLNSRYYFSLFESLENIFVEENVASLKEQ